MARTSFAGSTCPVARAVDVVGDPWSLLVVRDAFDGLRRFGEFQRSLGVAKNVLANRLRVLVDAGVLERVPGAGGSGYHEYALTDKGRELFPVVVALRQWGETHEFETDEQRSVLLEREGGRPVRRLELRDEDGALLQPEDVVVRRPDGQGTPAE